MTRLLSQFSILTRLIVLSTILLSVPVATHLYLSSKIEDDSSTLANQERVVIALRKAHAVETKLVEVRRINFATEAANIRESDIVAHDQNNVRPLLRSRHRL